MNLKLLVAFIATVSMACGTKNVPTSAIPVVEPETATLPAATLLCGAERMGEYLPAIKGKRVALVVNHTSMVGQSPTAKTPPPAFRSSPFTAKNANLLLKTSAMWTGSSSIFRTWGCATTPISPPSIMSWNPALKTTNRS